MLSLNVADGSRVHLEDCRMNHRVSDELLYILEHQPRHIADVSLIGTFHHYDMLEIL